MAQLEARLSELLEGRGCADRGAAHVRSLPSGTPRWIVALQRRIRGVVSVPGMANYESARGGGNPSYPARPAAVVFCATEQDVRMSLLAAQDSGTAFRLRSGRHNLAGYSNVDDGLVVDVRQLNDVAVDHAARTVTVGSGANLGELNAALDVSMLHVPAGTSSVVGVAGFVQGGGYGWTTRQYGMNCDRVAAVRVMLADGRVIRATRDLNPSLLWAVCGGTGGTLGVLLDVTYDLAELYIAWGFALQWPIDDAPRVLAALQDGFMRAGEAPDELGFRCMLATMGGRQVLLMLGVFDGDRQAGTEVLAPLTAIGACTVAMDATDTYAVLNERLLRVSAELVAGWAGTYSAHRSGYIVRPLGIDGWMAVVEHFKTTPHALNVVVVTAYGGQVSRIPADDCAFVHRAVDMNLSVDAAWDAGGRSSTEEEAWDWANGFLDVLAPFRDGSVYQNLPERGLADYRSAYWGANFGRLLAVKRIADPDDVFTHPQGVSPDPAVATVVPRLPELEPETGLKNVYDGVRRGLANAGTLRERLAELSDLGRAGALLAWDQQVMMPAGGEPARALLLGTVRDLARARLVAPELSTLLATSAPGEPHARVLGRDQERTLRVPAQLIAELDRAGSEGMDLWRDARAHDDFGRVEQVVRRNVQLAREYAGCFPESEHPYDALLDRYEPGVTTAEVRALLEPLCDGLAPLVADLAGLAVPALPGPFPVAAQRAVALEIAAAIGFGAHDLRLDGAPHPFSCATAATDVRVTARFEDSSLAGLFGCLHELGHAVYERGIDPALARTTLDVGTSIGVH
ncbi:MAG: FAD-binding protein, partial [Solirubrobacteraceae bacterium]